MHKQEDQTVRIREWKVLNSWIIEAFHFGITILSAVQKVQKIFFFQNILLVKVAKHAENILKYNMYSII